MAVYSIHPVPNDISDFFGQERDHWLHKIIANLSRDEPRSWAVYGGRGMGKTSLFYRIQLELTRSYQSNDICYLPIYVDLGLYTPLSQRQFFQILAKAFIESVERQAILPAAVLETFKTSALFQLDGLTFPDQFSDVYNGLMSQMSRKFRQTRIMFLLDEVDCLNEAHDEEKQNILTHLRAFIRSREKFPYCQNTVLILAGTNHTLSDLRGTGSPLANELRQIVLLRTFSRPDTKSLTDIYPHGPIEDEVIDALHHLTGGHPYLLQYTLSELETKQIYAVTEDHINQTLQQYSEKNPIFKSWTTGRGGFNTEERQIYIALANTKSPLTIDDLQSQHPTTNINTCLDTLLSTGVVREVDHGYLVNGTVFQHWYLQQYPKRKEDPGMTESPNNNPKQLTRGALVVSFMFVVVFAVLIWAAQSLSDLNLIFGFFVFTIAIICFLSSIIFVLVAANILTARQAVAFYNRILDLIPRLGTFLKKK